jgi:hypothetical protein
MALEWEIPRFDDAPGSGEINPWFCNPDCTGKDSAVASRL